jgi:predicted PurR-regulated permease PerM
LTDEAKREQIEDAVMRIYQKIIRISIFSIIIIILCIISIFFIPKMMRGQKLINEINNYFSINNEYPNGLKTDQNDILKIYKKVFPNENIYIGNFPQPHYSQFNNEVYYLTYMIGWSNIFVWEWLFKYDSSTKRWKIGHMQYAPRN